MKTLQTWMMFGLVSLAGAALAQAPQSGATEKAIVALENQWLKSEQTNNVDLASPLLADRFLNTTSEGALMNRAQSFADAKATKYTSASYEDVAVSVFGDTAIATGIFKAKGTDSSGKPMDIRDRWTDTWVKMPDGKWQCVATHSSHVS